jgi:hypothetical protein
MIFMVEQFLFELADLIGCALLTDAQVIGDFQH